MILGAGTAGESFSVVSGWIGVITGVTGIVLSVVAIVFAVLVQKDANRIATQTIESLKKIEADVNRVSEDTKQLIKAAWDELVIHPTRRAQNGFESELPAVSGAEELKTAIEAVRFEVERTQQENWESWLAVLDEVNSSISVNLADSRPRGKGTSTARPQAADIVGELRDVLDEGGPSVVEFLRALLAGRHLTSAQFKLLSSSTIGTAVDFLRQKGVLTPVISQSELEVGNDEVVYWLNPNIPRKAASAALLMFGKSEEEQKAVARELARVGYREPATSKNRKRNGESD